MVMRVVAVLGVVMVVVQRQHLPLHHVIGNLLNLLVTSLLVPEMKAGRLSVENVEFIKLEITVEHNVASRGTIIVIVV